MDREKILEIFYEVVNESVDWYAEDNTNNANNTYTHFISGVLEMTNKLLEQAKPENSNTTNDTNKTTVRHVINMG